MMLANSMKRMLLLGLFLCFCFFVGCSNQNPTSLSTAQKTAKNEYATKVHLIKQNSRSGQEMENAIKKLHAEYETKCPGANTIPFLNNNPFSSKAGLSSAQLKKTSIALPLKKTSVARMQLAGVKSVEAELKRPFFQKFTVPPYSWFSVNCTSSVWGVDPFLVMYKVENGDPQYDNTLQQNLTVLNFNDDYNGLCPYGVWGNISDVDQDIWVLVFAYSSSGQGTASLDVSINYGIPQNYQIDVVGIAMFYDNCCLNGAGGEMGSIPSSWQPLSEGLMAVGTTPMVTLDGFSFGDKAPYSLYDSYVWAFNFDEMKGIANDDYASGDYSSGTSTNSGWMTFPTSFHYPSVILLGGYSNYGTARLIEVVPYVY